MEEKLEVKIAKLVKESGGNTFYVGGYVRDKLLGKENKDVDIEVHGIGPERLMEILNSIGEVLEYGESFGIYAIRGQHLDIALPRKEISTGSGHRDFEVEVDSFIGFEKAARRRDFTINALMQDVLTGEISDYFGGKEDIKKKLIRHVDEKSFVEDPLRVFRAAQFASRFAFKVAPETISLCQKIDTSKLSKERIEGELRKALIKGEKPSLFFETLREMEQLAVWFEEIEALIGLKQDPIYHPEGDVYTHTMEVLDRTVKYKEEVSEAYYFALLALCHDLGKIITTKEVNGRVHAYEHEKLGLPLINNFLKRITDERLLNKYVTNMTSLHMKPGACINNHSSLKTTNKMFDEAISPKDLIYFALCDKNFDELTYQYNKAFLMDRYLKYEETMAKPYVSGKDLIASGLKPNEQFGDILNYAHKLRLAGIEKKLALVQTLAYARKKK